MTDGVRPPPEGLVNPASFALSFDRVPEGTGQPAWPALSPVAWDYPEACSGNLAATLTQLRAFKERG